MISGLLKFNREKVCHLLNTIGPSLNVFQTLRFIQIRPQHCSDEWCRSDKMFLMGN